MNAANQGSDVPGYSPANAQPEMGTLFSGETGKNKKYCTNCGSEVTGKFCSNCGTKVEE